jgi:hypothetical protein
MGVVPFQPLPSAYDTGLAFSIKDAEVHGLGV